MSIRVIGYQDGRRIVVDEGVSRARVSGYGGSAIGHTVTQVKPAQRHHPPLRHKDRLRGEALLNRKRGNHPVRARARGRG